MTILIVADLHFAPADGRSSIAARRGDLTPRLLAEIAARKPEFDGVLALGDLVEDGRHSAAGENLTILRQALEAFGKPFSAIPGNHDRDEAQFARVFGPPQPLRLGGYVILPFWDHYDEKDVCTRDFDAMEAALANLEPGERCIIAQHSPILPEIESAYPYNPLGYGGIAEVYTRRGVCLSLSGHYHKGIPAFTSGGVWYFCTEALCEAPFPYYLVNLEENCVHISRHTLEECVREL